MKRAACAVGLAIAFVATAARADGSRVVLSRERDDDVLGRVELRVAAELRAAGFTVDDRPADGADVAADAQNADAGDARFATVVLRRARRGTALEITVDDRITKKTVTRRIDAGRGERAEKLLSMRVVELLRASLVEPLVVEPPEGEPPAAAPLPPDVAAFAAPRDVLRAAPRFELGAGLAVIAGADVGLAWGPTVHASLSPCGGCRAGVVLAGPAFGASVDAREGSAAVRQELALAEASLDLARSSWFSPFVAAAAGAYHLHAQGTARAPFVDARDDAWAALAVAGAGARARLADHAHVTLAARALFAFPRPVLDFAGDRVATVGRPSWMLALSLDADVGGGR